MASTTQAAINAAGTGDEIVITAGTYAGFTVIVAAIILGGALWLWAELAVGIFTNWGS